MKDKIDEFFEIFGNDKKSLINVVIAYIVIMVIVLVVIWWPKGSNFAKYEKVDIASKKSTAAQNYLNTLTDMLRNSKKEQFKQLISNRYINYTGYTSDEIIESLDNLGYFSNDVTVSGMNIYADGDTYVYSTTAYSGENKKTINIIERYPYEYEIVFDDFYSYDQTNRSYTSKNIKFTLLNIYRNLKYIEINMKIENLNSTYARFDFSSTVGVQAVLEDGTKVSLANSISNEANTNIESNMTVNKKFVFEIPAQLQEGIEYIVFNGVSLEFSEVDIKVAI